MRGPTGAAVLGTACSQVRWHEPPITSRSPCPSTCRTVCPAPPPTGRSMRARGAPMETMAIHRVLGRRATVPVAVPGDRVASVAVEAHPGGRERLSEFVAVVRRQHRTGLRQNRIGPRLALAVETQQAGGGDLAIPHHPTFAPPVHAGTAAEGEACEQLIGARQPPRAYVDPGAPRQWRAMEARAEWAQPHVVDLIQQRSLEREVHAHDNRRMFDEWPEVGILMLPRSRPPV